MVHDMRCPNYTGFKTRLGWVWPRRWNLRPVWGCLRSPEPSGSACASAATSQAAPLPGTWAIFTAGSRPAASASIRTTAAHKTLPLGTHVLPPNRARAKQVVRINDRGPYIRGRLIDLSRAAAKALGMMSRGHDTVVLREVPAGDDVVASQYSPEALTRLPPLLRGRGQRQCRAKPAPRRPLRHAPRPFGAPASRRVGPQET